MKLVKLLVALAVITFAGAAACEPESRNVCGLEVQPPIVSEENPLDLEAIALADCDEAPATHTMRVHIEREVTPGVWLIQVARDGQDHATCTDIPTPGNAVTCSFFIPCVDGNYLAVARVTGEGTQRPFDYTEESATTNATCPFPPEPPTP